MSRDYQIGMLWVEGPLSFVEVLCAKSFVDAGHHVKLFHYGDVKNVPDGVDCVDGNGILKIDNFIRHGRTGSFALFSDVFRYHLLRKSDRMIWADLDAYCVKPFETGTGHFYGWESPHGMNGGVLGLPPDSDALGQLLEMTEDEYGIPEWFPQQEKDRLQKLKDDGTPEHVSEMPWGVWGPRAITHYTQKTGEDKYALPVEGLYPVSFRHRRQLLRTKMKPNVHKAITPGTFSVHFYGRRVKDFLAYLGGLPEPDSYMDDLLKKHGVDPAAAPVPGNARMEAKAAADKAKGQVENPPKPAVTPAPPVVLNATETLTDIADRHGSDKGTRRHRYTEFYHMLLLPYRQRGISVLEVEMSDPRVRDRLPSTEMWLEYFPKAAINRMDATDVSWFTHDRFTAYSYDPDDRETIRAALGQIDPAPMVVIDGGSHASQHQQNAFLEIFPKIQSGGLYMIENLRQQPEDLEQPGVTRTNHLFRSWHEHGEFIHSDAGVAEEFNALSPLISGCVIEPVHFQRNRRDQLVVIQKR